MKYLKPFNESNSKHYSQLVKDLVQDLEDEDIKIKLSESQLNDHMSLGRCTKWNITIYVPFPTISFEFKERTFSKIEPQYEKFINTHLVVEKWIKRLDRLDEFLITNFDFYNPSSIIENPKPGDLKYSIGFVRKDFREEAQSSRKLELSKRGINSDR